MTALERQLGDLCTGIGDIGVAVRLLDDPGQVLIDVRRIDAQEKMLWAHAVDGEIIDDPPVWITEGRVVHLEDFQLRRIIGGESLHHLQCPWPADLDLSHMTDIEESDRRAHSLMLFENAGILHRHFPAAEVDEFRACGPVSLIERRPFQAQRSL